MIASKDLLSTGGPYIFLIMYPSCFLLMGGLFEYFILRNNHPAHKALAVSKKSTLLIRIILGIFYFGFYKAASESEEIKYVQDISYKKSLFVIVFSLVLIMAGFSVSVRQFIMAVGLHDKLYFLFWILLACSTVFFAVFNAVHLHQKCNES